MTLIPQNAIDCLRTVQTLIMAPPPGEGFNMGTFRAHTEQDDDGAHVWDDKSPAKHSCGTVMCIGGWMVNIHAATGTASQTSVFNLLKMDISNTKLWTAFERLFFAFDKRNEIPLSDLTAEQASRAIDQFIATDGAKAWWGIA